MSEMAGIELDIGVLQGLLEPLDVAGPFAHDLLAGTQQTAHLLGLGVRHEAASDQSVGQKIGQPCRVVHVGLAARHVLHMRRVGQQQREIAIAEDVPDRLPVNSGRLHDDMGAALRGQPFRQFEQRPGRCSTVRTSRWALPFSVWREHATTMSLCTSRPAQRGYRTSMITSWRAASVEIPVEGTLENALRDRKRSVTQSGVLRDLRSNLSTVSYTPRK